MLFHVLIYLSHNSFLASFKVEIENLLALTYHYEVKVDGCRIMTPCAFTLVPCKPRVHNAILSTTGHNFSQNNEGSIYGWLATFLRKSLCCNLFLSVDPQAQLIHFAHQVSLPGSLACLHLGKLATKNTFSCSALSKVSRGESYYVLL